jgi:hypothetical protein
VFGTVAAVVPWFARMIDHRKSLVQEANTQYNAEFVEVSTMWRTDLYSEPSWADEKNNLVRIPIEAAMQQVVRSYSAGK